MTRLLLEFFEQLNSGIKLVRYFRIIVLRYVGNKKFFSRILSLNINLIWLFFVVKILP